MVVGVDLPPPISPTESETMKDHDNAIRYIVRNPEVTALLIETMFDCDRQEAEELVEKYAPETNDRGFAELYDGYDEYLTETATAESKGR